MSDTIVAAATAAGRAGVAVLRISGPLGVQIAHEVLGMLPPPRFASTRAFLGADGAPIDHGLALYFPAPRSYTGEDVLELHGHGGAVLVQAMIGMAGAILAESTLSFLGLGVLAPTASWGAMLNDARSHLFDASYLVVFPALGLMWAVMAFNLLGDALRDWLDPRTRSQLVAMYLAR